VRVMLTRGHANAKRLHPRGAAPESAVQQVVPGNLTLALRTYPHSSTQCL